MASGSDLIGGTRQRGAFTPAMRSRGAQQRTAAILRPSVLAVAIIAGVLLLFYPIAHDRGPQDTRTLHTTATATAPATGPTTRTAPGITQTGDHCLQWHRPRTTDRQSERDRMVDTQIARGGFGYDAVHDLRVLAAVRAVARHEFVPPSQLSSAYDDTPLPIGSGQTISQPYIVALMTELLAVAPGDAILEIGTGSGYQAAVLSELTPFVYTIENVKALQEESAARLERLGYETIQCRFGDGYDGWPEHAPFDGIIVTCAADRIPTPLWDQLKTGGRMVIPVGGIDELQRLLVLTKDDSGQQHTRSVLPVRFVPMTGKAQHP